MLLWARSEKERDRTRKNLQKKNSFIHYLAEEPEPVPPVEIFI